MAGVRQSTSRPVGARAEKRLVVDDDPASSALDQEINNAVHDGLLSEKQLEKLIRSKSPKTSLCLTGRDFPDRLLPLVDIATNMTKIKHHFDEKFLANKGIDF